MSSRPIPLHVVVLAAGVGSRLSGTSTRPKWLTEVAGRTIADNQLAGIDQLDQDVQLDVVTGHQAALVAERVALRAGTTTVHNARYAELNNWFTVLVALRHRREAGRQGTLVIVNSDLWAPSTWFADALTAVASCETPALVVDTARPLTDEAMKVEAQHGHATAIGKVGVTQPVGEYTGVLSVPVADLPVFEKALSSFVDDPDRVNAWYEHAVDVTFGMGLEWGLVEAPAATWVEIDDDNDLAIATELAGGPR
jgi:choline kinase